MQSGVMNLTGATAAGMLGGANGLNNIGGTRAPDLIGVLKVDQAWGVFQMSAVAHNNHAAYYGGTETTGHPDDKWGWAVQGALQIKNIPTGAGDVLNMQAVYTDGATRYNLQSLAAVSYSMFGSASTPGAYQSIGFASAPDAVYTGTSAANGTGLENVTIGASAAVTLTTGIPTGTPASTVLTLLSSTATTARLASARMQLGCWPWLVAATPTSTLLRRVSSLAGPR